MIDGKQLIKRWERLSDARRTWDNTYQELATYILPRRANITVVRTPGVKQTERLYDGTAIHANELLAASLAGSLTSGADRWFSLKMSMAELNDDSEVAQWLDDVADRIYLGLNQSNFSAEGHEVYLDIGGFGTGCLFCLEAPIRKPGFNGFTFAASPIGSYCIAEDGQGKVDTVMRKIQMSILAAANRWGVDKLSEQVQQKYAHEDKRDEMISIIHAAYPRGAGRGYLSTRMPYASCYVELETKHCISEGGFHEFPAMVPRWAKSSGEVYGRGPGFTALPDIRTLNKSVELKLKALAKAIDPPLMVRDDGVIGRVSVAPAALTTVRDMESIAPMINGTKFDVVEMEEERLKQSIQNAFYSDLIKISEKSYMTATEVESTIELMHRYLGPTIGRLESEYLQPLINRCFGILYRAGALPPVPQAIMESGNTDIDVEYEGPLARAQRGGMLLSIQKAYNLIMPISQMQPELIDVFDPGKVGRYIGKGAGVPMQLMRSDKDVAKVQAARTQDMQNREQTAQGLAGAEMNQKNAAMVKAQADAAQPATPA